MIKNTLLDFELNSKEDIINAVNRLGFLPYFKNKISGFSIEEHIAPQLWFSDTEGVWEWKGSIITEGNFAYGKFFGKKAVFMTLDWFLELANYRRDGYDFDAGFDDGKLKYSDKILYDKLESNAPALSKTLKALGGYDKESKGSFDAGMISLQTKCYALISDFVYMTDKYGRPYGWGVAEYSTPETHFGKAFTDKVYNKTPEESYNRIFEHLKGLFPDTEDRIIKKFIR